MKYQKKQQEKHLIIQYANSLSFISAILEMKQARDCFLLN